MATIHLPDVTLVAIDGRRHELCREAVLDCLDAVEFGDVVLGCDNADWPKMAVRGARHLNTGPCETKDAYQGALWYLLPKMLETSHALIVQWDGFVVDPLMWHPGFLDYDYIGAPWTYWDDCDVGNGGFCLRSRELINFLFRHPALYPLDSTPEDALLGRLYARGLQRAGFKYPDRNTAADFAFECWRPNDNARSFGFHGFRNFPLVLNDDRLLKRLAMLPRSFYCDPRNALDISYAHANWEATRHV